MKDRLLRILFAVPMLKRLMWAFVVRTEQVEGWVFQRAASRRSLTLTEGSYLGWATGPEGYAAAAGLWINHPIAFDYHSGSVRTASVNERILEIPFVFGAVATLPRSARILDLGSTESTVALSLASLGYHVTSLDLRKYPFQHPNLQVVVDRIESWSGPAEPFDAIVSLSTLEHVGLEAYGQDSGDPDLDRQLMRTMQGWLKPGGILVLTAPYGTWNISSFERTYDDAHLDALVEGWEVVERRVFGKLPGEHWVPAVEGVAYGKGVVMMVLSRPGNS